jgi:hypothetical protein
MSTKKNKSGKRPPKRANGKAPTLRAEKERLERELKQLREENRSLKWSLGALICKDDPKEMDLMPDDGISEPSLVQLMKELERAGN